MKRNETVTKKEFVDRIADKCGCKRVVAKKVIQQFLDEIIEELARGNRLEFREFGVFETRERASRIAQNPKTMEKVPVPSKRTVKFKMGRLMRERMQEEPQAAPQLKIASAPVGDISMPKPLAAMPAESAQESAHSS